MQFDFTQRFGAPVGDVYESLGDPAFYSTLDGSAKIGAPEVLDRFVDGDNVKMRIRYRFTANLSSAVRAVIDPDKLTWVEESVHDPETRKITFVLKPDHYADRLKASGSLRLEADPDDDDLTRVHTTGDVKVRAPLVASSVERAIISGLQEHLEEEESLLRAFLNR